MLATLEKRNGYNLQTGYGHVRVLPFSDDAYVSINDLLRVHELLETRDVLKIEGVGTATIKDVMEIVKRHNERAR